MTPTEALQKYAPGYTLTRKPASKKDVQTLLVSEFNPNFKYELFTLSLAGRTVNWAVGHLPSVAGVQLPAPEDDLALLEKFGVWYAFSLPFEKYLVYLVEDCWIDPNKIDQVKELLSWQSMQIETQSILKVIPFSILEQVYNNHIKP